MAHLLISRSQVRVLPRAHSRRSQPVSITATRAPDLGWSINGPNSPRVDHPVMGALPTFTPARILFLLVVGPVTFLSVAAGIYASPAGRMLDSQWADGHPLVTVHHAHTGGGR
jgi:hypothetical protein